MFTEAKASLEEVAKANRTQICENSMKALLTPPAKTFNKTVSYFFVPTYLYLSNLYL